MLSARDDVNISRHILSSHQLLKSVFEVTRCESNVLLSLCRLSLALILSCRVSGQRKLCEVLRSSSHIQIFTFHQLLFYILTYMNVMNMSPYITKPAISSENDFHIRYLEMNGRFEKLCG